MSGSLSEYAAEALLAHVVGKTSFTMPTTYAALTTVIPTSSMTGATITEATYTGYVRVATAGAWGSPVAAIPSTISNTSAITWPACTGSSSVCVGCAILDSITVGAGNLIAWGSITSVTISTSNTPASIAIGALELTQQAA